MAAEALKAAGNRHFARGEFREAISKYTEALNLSRHHIYYSNRAAAYLKLNKASKALQDCKSCVQLAPTWVKVHGHLCECVCECLCGYLCSVFFCVCFLCLCLCSCL